ncbi:MAG TPA: 2Fe-2S iron-sulfur cluster-binding protein, partial [Acidimicrobiia bacterium]|nr:2Fe-2S iron-sulfur cluster-binding protein [Acidimicrobiia bacterium]
MEFTCNGRAVSIEIEAGESLLNVLRERLRLHSVKDGCAPQGQCGCCTVLVDGEPRVSCVTPATRVEGRSVTTLEGLEPSTRERFAASFVASGGSQCGFCTPGIIMRFAGARARDVDRSLAAHLCRCTGWLTVRDAVAAAAPTARDLDAASRRAELEGGIPQRIGLDVPLGAAGFA